MVARIKQNILVTGGGGFLGKAIVRRLVESGENVRSFSRRFYPELKSMGVDQIQGDIGDNSEVIKACNGIQTVFHVAAKPGVWGNYKDYYKTNVSGTKNVIEACNNHHISKLVYTSSPSVVFNGMDMEGVDESVPYPDHFHAHYPKTKAIAEQLVVSASTDKLRTIILRPHLIWGPEENNFVPRIIAKAGWLKIVGNGRNLVDTVYIDNAADAHILAAENLDKNPDISGNVYFISQDEPVLLWGLINAILKAAGLEPVKGSIPKQMAWLLGTAFEFLYKVLHIKKEPPMTRFVAEELATSHWFDISAARRDLGYSPRVSTEEGLRLLENWLKNKK
ncbi:MAG: NAD-dependent epimerase/dehydratase family protein [Deltaproteobacteria bacterium]|nr:NAD-dependent epimerase/dehydratase family protein [Deltaproteobacteria bacterium]